MFQDSNTFFYETRTEHHNSRILPNQELVNNISHDIKDAHTLQILQFTNITLKWFSQLVNSKFHV